MKCVKALTKMGHIYYSGLDSASLNASSDIAFTIAPNEEEAIKFYRQAADQNDSEALNSLGLIYEKRDPDQAIAYYKRSIKADLSNIDALFNLGLLLWSLPHSKEEGRQAMEQAMQRGHLRAKQFLQEAEGQHDEE